MLRYPNIKISIDFDSTLSRRDVQLKVKSWVDLGIDVWIVTSRFSTEEGNKKGWWWIEKNNKELYDVATICGIPEEKIVFTHMCDKIEFLKDKGFLFHLDDDDVELLNILDSSDLCVPVNVNYFEWGEICDKLIKEKINV